MGKKDDFVTKNTHPVRAAKRRRFQSTGSPSSNCRHLRRWFHQRSGSGLCPSVWRYVLQRKIPSTSPFGDGAPARRHHFEQHGRSAWRGRPAILSCKSRSCLQPMPHRSAMVGKVFEKCGSQGDNAPTTNENSPRRAEIQENVCKARGTRLMLSSGPIDPSHEKKERPDRQNR